MSNNIEITSQRDIQRLRKIALAAQGLATFTPFGKGLNGAKKALAHLGYVQIDTISVVQRAHHHVLFSRIPNYQPTMLNDMLSQGDIFEYWSHAASFLPMDDFRFSLPYKEAIKAGQTHWHKNVDRKLMQELHNRIAAEGPLRSRDLETERPKRQGWWDWKPAKKALEQLYMEGDLMVSSRDGFQKAYDLTERVLPDHIETRMPTVDEYAKHLLSQQLTCHGLVTLKGLTYLRKIKGLREAMKCLLQEKLALNEIQQVTLKNGDTFFINAGAFEHRLPNTNNHLSILSPFDNAVIQRERLNSLFQFNYQIECYVPEEKRQYGYFTLPLLYRNQFIGRMDCKAHRKEKRLEIKSLHFEDQQTDHEQLADAFCRAIEKFMHFQECQTITLGYCNDKSLLFDIRQQLSA